MENEDIKVNIELPSELLTKILTALKIFSIAVGSAISIAMVYGDTTVNFDIPEQKSYILTKMQQALKLRNVIMKNENKNGRTYISLDISEMDMTGILPIEGK